MLVAAISGDLVAGGGAVLRDFGRFYADERGARIGRNPRTGEEVKVPARKVVKFKPGKALADRVSGRA